MEQLIDKLHKLSESRIRHQDHIEQLYLDYTVQMRGDTLNSKAKKAYKKWDGAIQVLSREISPQIKSVEKEIINRAYGITISTKTSTDSVSNKVYLSHQEMTKVMIVLNTLDNVSEVCTFLLDEGLMTNSLSYPTIMYAKDVASAASEFEKCFSYNYKKHIKALEALGDDTNVNT